MSASTFLENKILDHVLGNTTYTQPATVYLALFTGAASTNLEANVITDEVATGNYAREVVTFAAASGGSISIDATVTFNVATADWGTVTTCAVMDSLTGGNVLYWGTLVSSKTVSTGDTMQFTSGNLTITLD